MAAIKQVHEFTDEWRFPEAVERFVRDHLPDGRVLNVPAGKSPLGDIKVDADPSLQDHAIQGDMFRLPFQDATFDGVIHDPPWRGVDVFDRHSLFYEIVRVTKPNGIIVHNATWIPDSKEVEKIDEYRRADDAFHDTSVIAVFRRHNNQQTLDSFTTSDPIAVDETATDLEVRTVGAGFQARGTLTIDGPDGRVVATKRYQIPGRTAAGGEMARCRERIEYAFPDCPAPERAAGVVPPRTGTVRIPTTALTDTSSVRQALDRWFRDDPQYEYRVVQRALTGEDDTATLAAL